LSRLTRVPGPLRRFFRDSGRLVAVLLFAVVALASSGVQSTAAAALQDTLDANWRGAYDILVTAKGAANPVPGLLAPNALSAGGAGLSVTDLSRIRSVQGVDVAAPIGEVIVAGLKPGRVTITLPMDAVHARSSAQAFRVTMTYTTNDGLGRRLVDRQVHTVIVDRTGRDVTPITGFSKCTIDDMKVDNEKYPDLCAGPPQPEPIISSTNGDGSWTYSDDSVGDSYVFSLGSAPQSLTRITLVDPVAEQRLLGKAGSFLEPLIRIKPTAAMTNGAMNTWAASANDRFSADFQQQQVQREAIASGGYTPKQLTQLKQLFADNGKTFKGYRFDTGGYVPLLVSGTGSAPLSMTIKAEGFGPTTPVRKGEHRYVVPDELKAGHPGTPLGESAIDVSALLNPFVQQPVSAPWPGTSAISLPQQTTYNSLSIHQTGTVGGTNFVPLEHVKKTGDPPAVRLKADGYLNPVPVAKMNQPLPDPFRLVLDGTKAGYESAYSSVTGMAPQINSEVAVPIGSFSSDAIGKSQSSLSYVPLGAYQAVGSTLVAGSSTVATKSVTVRPSVTGLGLVGPETVAIASVASAASWGQKTPISAVRVRVAGITEYSPAAQQKVLKVAQAIKSLGYGVTIVAGSSPTNVAVQVDDYAFGVTDPAQKQKVGPLGDVVQAWSELGAAGRADLAVSTSSLAILGIALGSSALLLGAVQFVSISRRREQAAILRQTGWTRGRIWRWMAAEEIPGAIVVALAGVAAVLLSHGSTLAITIATLGLAAVLVTSAIAVRFGSRARRQAMVTRRRSARRARKTGLHGRTVRSFGARQSLIHVIASASHFAAIVIVAVSAAALTAVFLEGRRTAGTSLLGQFVVAQAAVPQIVLGLSAITAGIVLAVIGRRVDLARRASQWLAMRAMGWTGRDLRRAQRTESSMVWVPAVLVATAAAYFGANWLDASHPLVVAAAAAVTGVLAAIVVLSVRRKVSAP
jgi:hypothetical protein